MASRAEYLSTQLFFLKLKKEVYCRSRNFVVGRLEWLNLCTDVQLFQFINIL